MQALPLQLVVVTTNSWDDSHGNLQRFERQNAKQAWHIIGPSWSVVVGKKGLALIKKEGDNKSPAGTYTLGPAFGFARAPKKSLKLPYLHIAPTTICVDDPKSQYYGRIIDSKKIPKKDWHSGEVMSQYPKEYRKGIVVNYNVQGQIASAGSCIFLHIKGSDEGTAGCTAMNRHDLDTLLNWLRPKAYPLLIQMPLKYSNA